MVLQSVSSGLNINLSFVTFDATDPKTFSKIDFSRFHLVMANFFASEIRKAKIVQKSGAFWKHMFTSMGSGKVFLALDFSDVDGSGWKYINDIVPNDATAVIADQSISMTCPDSKESILSLETEIDHRPKKNAKNFVLAAIT